VAWPSWAPRGLLGLRVLKVLKGLLGLRVLKDNKVPRVLRALPLWLLLLSHLLKRYRTY